MKGDLTQSKRGKLILRYVLDKGFEGASIREIWNELRETTHDIPIATIISIIDRMVELGQLIEKREEGTQGYFRRFYDPRYVQNDNSS
ncbi:MAG: hypothetical protein NWF07_02980 [Candidatus Bathyarchaeota archaeon]|nr:hypothetical protein [Candidatus Bathyarchaeota archaeon]